MFYKLLLKCHGNTSLIWHRRSKVLFISAAAKSLQLCPTLCDPIDGSPPSSSVPGILQAILEWLPVPSPMHACILSRFSRVWLCTTPWTAAYQAPLSAGFSRQEYLEWVAISFSTSLVNSPHNVNLCCCITEVFYLKHFMWKLLLLLPSSLNIVY